MKRAALLTLSLLVAGASVDAAPRVGHPVPAFAVNDLAGTQHTQRDFLGRWTVVVAITDKDSSDMMRAWYQQGLSALPATVTNISMAALDLFALVPTSSVLGPAREATPRARWDRVWLSRDGSLADSLGLGDTEEPWVFVVAPNGNAVEVIHGTVSPAGIARVRRALNLAP